MSRLHSRHGWLLYANPDLHEGAVIAGDVTAFELNLEQSHGWGTTLRVTFWLPAAGLRKGPPGAAQPLLESLMWDALQSWPQPGLKDGRRWPPEMEALLELAKRHPEEYERLCEGETVLWAPGG